MFCEQPASVGDLDDGHGVDVETVGINTQTPPRYQRDPADNRPRRLASSEKSHSTALIIVACALPTRPIVLVPN